MQVQKSLCTDILCFFLLTPTLYGVGVNRNYYNELLLDKFYYITFFLPLL